jgi:2-polyprenyl-6-methoxyphenol hydroxylase-like FAD-dependent oxidoreductase
MRRQLGGRAIVIGGSIAGLLAARALSDHFAEIVILERDPLGSDSRGRKGTPHAGHTHGLLAGGLQQLERLLPGTREELLSGGAESGDLLGDTYWFVHGGAHIDFTSGLAGSLQSRAFLEQLVRERVLRLPTVTLRDQVSVERPTTDRTGRIVGVQLTDRRSGRGEVLSADLVIDASGRGSRLPTWLAEMGYPAPQEERIGIDLGYATQIFRRRPDDFAGKLAVIITQVPPNRRMAVALAVEGQRWSLTLGGMGDDQPLIEPTAFRDFAEGLPSPLISQFLATAEPLSDVQRFRFPASTRRRYERLTRMPEGLLALGDSICSFNPIYGQGMTVAAFEASLLDECLMAGTTGLPRRFFRRAARLIDTAWQISATADFQFPEVRGRRPWSAGLLNRYMRQVHVAAHRDRDVALAFHRVANLLDSPASLFHPRILWRIVRGWFDRPPRARRASATSQICRRAWNG